MILDHHWLSAITYSRLEPRNTLFPLCPEPDMGLNLSIGGFHGFNPRFDFG